MNKSDIKKSGDGVPMENFVSTSWQIKNADPKRSLSQYRDMLNDLTRLISDWVWEIDQDLRLSYVSTKIFDSLGVASETVIGKKITQLGIFRSTDGAPVSPDFSRPFRDLVFEAENRNGQMRHFLISGLPVYNPDTGAFEGVRGISRDVTVEKNNKETLEMLGFAMENFPGLFFLTDKDDRLVFVNQMFREFNQITDDSPVIGMAFDDFLRSLVDKGLIPNAIGKEEEWVSYRMYLHRNPHGTFEVNRHDNVVMQVTECKLDDQSTASFSNDISELKRVEQALRQSAQRNRIFTMNVGHDLRTPLAVLSANIDNIEDKALAASLRQDVNAMARSVEQLLDATKWEKPEVGNNDRVDLLKVAQDVVSGLALSAIRAERNLELSGADHAVWVSGLAEPIEIAIRNLVENAIKYVPKNTLVVVRVDDDGSVQVSDSGPGISQTVRDNLTNPQVRFDRRGGNSGLGLSIVQRIAEAHGTSLYITDKKGGGTVCKLQFSCIQNI